MQSLHITRQRLPSHKKRSVSSTQAFAACSVLSLLPIQPCPAELQEQPQRLPSGEPDSSTELPAPGAGKVFYWELPKLPRKGDLANSQHQRQEIRCSKAGHHFYLHYPYITLRCSHCSIPPSLCATSLLLSLLHSLPNICLGSGFSMHPDRKYHPKMRAQLAFPELHKLSLTNSHAKQRWVLCDSNSA